MLETQLEESASVQIFDGWICFAPFKTMVFDGLAACAVISCSVRVTGIPPLREAHRPQEEILSLRLTGENSGFSLWKSATSCQPAGFSRFSVDWMSQGFVAKCRLSALTRTDEIVANDCCLSAAICHLPFAGTSVALMRFIICSCRRAQVHAAKIKGDVKLWLNISPRWEYNRVHLWASHDELSTKTLSPSSPTPPTVW